jgi:hypothetical protein
MPVYDAVTDRGFRKQFKSKHLLNYGQQIVTKRKVKYTIVPKKEAKCLDTISAGIVAQEYVRDALFRVAEFKRQASLLK